MVAVAQAFQKAMTTALMPPSLFRDLCALSDGVKESFQKKLSSMLAMMTRAAVMEARNLDYLIGLHFP